MKFSIIKALLCVCALHCSAVLAFLPKEEKTIAISCGDNKFYKDTASRILYKPDTYRDGGQIARREDVKFMNRKTIFDDNYDWSIHKTYVYDKKSFSYHLPLRRQGDYSLIMVFAEINDIGPKKRVFNVIVEDEILIPNLDIYSLTGGKQIPYYEIVELNFSNKVLKNKSKDSVIKNYNITYQNLNVTFESVIGSAKLDAIILYEGTFQDIKKHMVDLFMDKSNNGEGLKMNQLRIFMQGNQITCKSDKDYVFPLRQYFIKKINEQHMQSCSQNAVSQFGQTIPPVKIPDEQEVQSKRKLNSQQMHNSRKNPPKRPQELIEYIKDVFVSFAKFLRENVMFFSCLFLHYIVISFLFRDRNKDKGNKYNQKHSPLSFKQIVSQANSYQQQQQLLMAQMAQQMNVDDQPKQ